MVLTSVSVRHGETTRVYAARTLIGARVVDFAVAPGLVAVVPVGTPIPTGTAREELLDGVLNRGLVNPRRGERPESPGLRLRFAAPVVNRAGPDVVVFELQTDAGNSPLGGDAFRLAAIAPDGAVWSGEIGEFSVGFAHPAAQQVLAAQFLGSPEPGDWRQAPWRPQGDSDGGMVFKVIGTAVDLSDLGVPADAAVAELVVQPAPTAKALIDPVCVAGLPEPSPEHLLAAAPPNAKAPPKPVLEPMLDGPLRDVAEVVFAVRVPGTDHWYANFGYYSAPKNEYPPQRAPDGPVKLRPAYKDGGQLAKINLRSRAVTFLLDNASGSVRDPVVDYDGQTIFFSYRPGGTSFYHPYRIQADGSGLQQITEEIGRATV